MDKLSLIGIINEESGEKGFAELVLRNLVKTGEKTLPKEIGRYEVNGVKMVLKTESYTYLMTKGVLTNEERLIIRQINRNIINKVGEDIFVVAIKEATRGLDRFGTKAVENRILNNYFDGESIARIENKLRPGMGGSTQLPAVIERRIEEEIRLIPENGAIANRELPDITDVTTSNSITILKNRANEYGLNTENGLVEKLLETVNKSLETNKDLANAVNKQTDVIMNQAAEKIKTQQSTPTGVPNDVPKNVSSKLTRSLKKLFMSGKSYAEIQSLNAKLTALQIASVLIDIMGTDKGFKEFDQPITGLNMWEIAGVKIGAGIADKIFMGFGVKGKLLLAVNYVLTGIDVTAMGIDLYKYHGPRKEKQKQEKIKQEKEKRKLDSLKKVGAEELEKLKKIDKQRTLDSLKQQYSVDSLNKAVMDKLNPNKMGLDTGGKEQIIDPFKQ